ncbi:MAG: NUDIX domain-containing protein [Acinetobacter sp.]|nr:MAG: NUDIX domain-containing protein [Acinetobacter sp.]
MLESAGILAYRFKEGVLSFFLAHPGGPFFKHKDNGWWTIPKGLIENGEDLLVTAKREFLEEVGVAVTGDFLSLGHITQKGGKRVHCFAVAFDVDPTTMVSNTFELQWPPKSGRLQSFPEVDRAGWFDFTEASTKINQQQAVLLDRLVSQLGV